MTGALPAAVTNTSVHGSLVCSLRSLAELSALLVLLLDRSQAEKAPASPAERCRPCRTWSVSCHLQHCISVSCWHVLMNAHCIDCASDIACLCTAVCINAAIPHLSNSLLPLSLGLHADVFCLHDLSAAKPCSVETATLQTTRVVVGYCHTRFDGLSSNLFDTEMQ